MTNDRLCYILKLGLQLHRYCNVLRQGAVPKREDLLSLNVMFLYRKNYLLTKCRSLNEYSDNKHIDSLLTD